MGSQTFSHTGAQQTFVVPGGVTSLDIEALGASASEGAARGGRTLATLAVTAGETLYINVGGKGSGNTGGFNGGGNTIGGGVAGAGASDVRQGGSAVGNRVVIAGGAGAPGALRSLYSTGDGGNGGAPAATAAAGSGGATSGGGGGGTQAAGGAAGSGPWPGVAGALATGGGFTDVSAQQAGGGGGGGRYGGGSGSGGFNGGSGGGGGGGSSAAISPATLTGGSAGYTATNTHGSVVLTWTDPPTEIRTGTVTAAPALSAAAIENQTRTAALAASPALTASAFPAMVRTAPLPSAPVLTAVAFIDDGTRTGTVTAAPALSAVAVGQLTRTATVTAAAALSAVAVGQVSPARTATLTVAPALTAVALISLQTRTGTLTAAPALSGPAIPDVITPPGPPVVKLVDLRLRAYAPNGASLGLLPAPDGFAAAVPLNEVPSLTGTYAIGAARSDLLGQPLEVALEITIDGGASWFEYDDCRFLYLTDGRDPVKTADAYGWEAKGYIWRLSKARVRAEGALNGEGRREFSATVGSILSTFWSEAQARGALSGMTLQGDATVDAAGVPWSITLLNRSYDLGQDYLSILLDLAAAGWVDFRVSGRTVKLYNPGTVMAVDRSIGVGQTALRPLQTTEAPFRRTWEGLANFIQVIGDEGATVELTNPGGLAPWGRWEDFLAQAGVTDVVTLGILGTAYQQLTNAERVEYTQGLALGLGPVPIVNFKSGDYVLSNVLGGTAGRYRVRQVTVQKDGNTVLGNVVLNDKFAEQDIRVHRLLDAIMTGAASSSSGGIPTPPGPDILQPAQVGTPSGSSSVFVDAGGVAWAAVALDWLDVTTNLDGTPITDLDHYEVQAKKGDSAATTAWLEVTRTSESRATASPYVPGDVWTFRVRAVDTSNNFGPWSTSLTLTMQADTTGPVKPSTPTATSRLGVGTVTWDGLPQVGVAMDADFDHVDIHLSNTSGFTYSGATKVSDLPGAGKALAGPLTYSATYYGRLVPYDTSGNAGTPSDQFSFTVTALVDVSNFPDDAMEDLYARTGHFLVVETDQLNANSAAIGFLDTGYIIGAIIQGTEFWTNANPTAGGMRLRDADGFKAWRNSDGALMVEINRTTGKLTAASVDISSADSGVRTLLETVSHPVFGAAGAVSFRNGSTLMGQLVAYSDGVQLFGPDGLTDLTTFVAVGDQHVGISAPLVTITSYHATQKVVIGGPGLALGGGDITGVDLLSAQAVTAGSISFPSGLETPTTGALPNGYIDSGGNLAKSTDTITRGAADSGGSGFRLLRVAN